jgi:hypothetical protein
VSEQKAPLIESSLVARVLLPELLLLLLLLVLLWLLVEPALSKLL